VCDWLQLPCVKLSLGAASGSSTAVHDTIQHRGTVTAARGCKEGIDSYEVQLDGGNAAGNTCSMDATVAAVGLQVYTASRYSPAASTSTACMTCHLLLIH
jgi:hypothetical protein